MKGKRFIKRLSLLSIVALLVAAIPVLAEVASPNALRSAIDVQYEGIDWIGTQTLAGWMSQLERRRIILLDVRERREFDVSHLRGARLVDPDLQNVGSLSLPRDATIVVYCSVGYRSAAMAQRLEAAGYSNVLNLQGGLFQWANEGRPLYRGVGRTELVHPYDNDWGQMLIERYRSPL
jgi:rhodanese-related sulfurtransferase